MNVVRRVFKCEKCESAYLYVNSSIMVSRRTLSIIRLSFAFVLLLISIQGQIMWLERQYWRYFTQWGLTLSCITLCLMGISPYISSPTAQSEGLLDNASLNVEDSQSSVQHFSLPFPSKGRLSMLIYVLYETSWTIDVLISTVFWLILLPFFFLDNKIMTKFDVEATAWVYIFNISAHALPILFFSIDNIFNLLAFTPHHYWFPFFFTFVYMLMDLILAFTTGESAYPILTYKNGYTPLVIIGFFVFLCLGFALGYFWQHKKIKKLTDDFWQTDE